MGGPTDGAPVGAPGASSAPMGQTVVESGADHPAAVARLRVGALATGRVGGARGHPVAAWVDGQRSLQPPPPARNPAPGKLFPPVWRACTGGLFALKAGSCPTVIGVKASSTRLSVDWSANASRPRSVASAVSGRRRVLICLREEQSASI